MTAGRVTASRARRAAPAFSAAIWLVAALHGCAKRPETSAPSGTSLARAPCAPSPAAASVATSTSTALITSASTKPASGPEVTKVDLQDKAMGTEIHFIALTNAKVDAGHVQAAMTRALDEIARLEKLLTDWTADSDVGRINAAPGEQVSVAPETFEVIQKARWAGDVSHGSFDITFQTMKGVWRFGDAQDAEPKPPGKADVERLRRLVDYRKLKVDEATRSVSVGKGQQLGLGGIAKGYIVDRAAAVLRQAGVSDFLVQAGGDLYGAGKKPDGSPWVSGIQDPRGPVGSFFATIELTDHAFSTAGDYARAYVYDGKRYHHIIDPRSGYPATASRSVTIWAKDAFTADAIDDAVFILGPAEGLKLVESIDDAGAVIVDAHNKVWVSPRLETRVHLTKPPTDGI